MPSKIITSIESFSVINELIHLYVIKGFDSATGLCEDGGGLVQKKDKTTCARSKCTDITKTK